MLRSTFICPALIMAASFALVGCGGDDSQSSAGGGGNGPGSSGTSGGGEKHAGPPGRPSGAPDGDGPGVVFAIKYLYLGDLTRDMVTDKANAWKDFGFDLDGKVTNCEGNDCQSITDQCKPNSGGSATNIYPDGTDGIDNSFGYNIYDNIILGVQASASTDINAAIADGSFTIMLSVDGLGSSDLYDGLHTGLFGGADLGHAADFSTGNEEWPLIPELLDNPGATGSQCTGTCGPKVSFDNSYVVDNTWVSGDKGDVQLNIAIQGFALTLNIHSAQIAFDMAADHKSATNGTVAGVLDTDELVEQIRMIAGSFDPGLCAGSTVESILNQIRQASDIMIDGSAVSSSDICNGISIGIGFDAGIVQLGPIAEEAMGGMDPCAP